MNTHWSTAALCALVAITGAACGDTVKVNETEKGGLGESCRARNDCEGDLVCRDNVCTNEGGAGGGSDAGSDAAVITQVRGGEGESCQSRADCEGELACIDNVCTAQAESDAGMSEVAATRGKRGESCAATSDCEAGLVCIGQRCNQANVEVAYSSKECSIVQCAVDADCCADFTIRGGFSQDDCDQMRAECLDPIAPVAASCFDYADACVCEGECGENERCTSFQACLTDSQCGGSRVCINERCEQCAEDLDCQFVFGRPYCASNQCVACRADADCGADQTCVDGVCNGGCVRDEQCDLFEACVDSECVEVGCQSDRECFFHLRDERAVCLDGDCAVPCETDAECPIDSFMICEDQVCRPVGCETDAECRAALSVANRPSGNLDRAVCREPAE